MRSKCLKYLICSSGRAPICTIWFRRKECTTRRESSSTQTCFTRRRKASQLLSLPPFSISWRRTLWRRLSVASSLSRKISRAQNSVQTQCGLMVANSTPTLLMISSKLLRYPSMLQTPSFPPSLAKRRLCRSSFRAVLRDAAATTQSPQCSNPNPPSWPTTRPRSPSGTYTENSSD